MIIVYTTGVFDLLHPGHLNILRRARSLGDKLIVGVQEDDSVLKQKGKKPIMTCAQRILMLEALPFVDVVIPYSNTDQREMLDIIKPNVVVQGGDWLKTGDRSLVVDYLKKNNIRLIQFPYSNGISSTEIKERVYADLSKVKKEKKSEFDFYRKLKLVPINNLLIYEKFDLRRVKKIVNSINSNKCFFNPILVGDIGEKDRYIVIDGANRLEALKKVKASYAFIQIVDYLDPNEVDLQGNEHYLNCSFSAFMELMNSNGFTLKVVSEKEYLLAKSDISPLIYSDGKVYSLDFSKISSVADRIEKLNIFVEAYKKKFEILRRSELGNFCDFPIVIKFKSFTPSDIIELSYNSLYLESGITWHSINDLVVHFRIPIQVLIVGFSNMESSDFYLKKVIENKISNSWIRRYNSNVYICDEWDIN